MKKMTLLLLCLSLTLGGASAMAESAADGTVYSGNVAYRSVHTIAAPFGGTLADYSVQVGDMVQAGDALFSLSTEKVYATMDGTARGVRVAAGDDAADITARYGALLYLEPVGRYTVSTSTANAYKSDSNNNENRYLNEGETVYLRSSDDNDRTGTGIITKVDGRNFTVEVSQSNLNVEDTVSIYRDAKFSTSQRLASYAKVQRAASTAVTADGSVFKCLVTEGQAVKRGDVLLEIVTGTLDGLNAADNAVAAPEDGVILSLPKAAGSAVNQKDVLATYYASSDLWVQFSVDESDLDTVVAGQRVNVQLDVLTGHDAVEGTVVSVGSIPGSASGESKYMAYAELTSTDALRDGMSVSVTLQ
ncbi:MAG TPA: HlyD family efflux transporter periplasmic adaptor subunit [Candidatus Limiplasma sp.]|nr:HlyD family efflux transporter periplasmic adaptor subunit [Candidatus Limiplasma sp.]